MREDGTLNLRELSEAARRVMADAYRHYERKRMAEIRARYARNSAIVETREAIRAHNMGSEALD